MRMLSHQARRHAQQGLPIKTETMVRYRPSSLRRIPRQAGELQERMTAILEKQVLNEANHSAEYSPMEF